MRLHGVGQCVLLEWRLLLGQVRGRDLRLRCGWTDLRLGRRLLHGPVQHNDVRLRDPQRAPARDGLLVGQRLLLGHVYDRIVRLRSARTFLRREL